MTAMPGAEDDVRSLFGESAAVFVSLAGPSHVVEAANPAFLAALEPGQAWLGVALAELMPTPAGHGIVASADQAYRTGEAGTSRDVPIVLGAGPQAREALFDLTLEPRRDGDGTVTGVQLIGVETTQVKQA